MKVITAAEHLLPKKPTVLSYKICFNQLEFTIRSENRIIRTPITLMQVRGVIELTRAFIPIISAGLSVKTLILILTLISINGHEDFSTDAHFLLRMVRFQVHKPISTNVLQACTIYSLALPFLLIFPVKTLRRRFHSFCSPFKPCPVDIQPPIRKNSDEATEKHFAELLKQWH